MHILEDGDTFHFYNSLKINGCLEPGNYTLRFNGFGSFYLQRAPAFSLPSKIYDISKDDRDIIINRFNTSERNMGVLLTGKKGFGKTIDAKLICRDLNIPVIIITDKIPAGFDFKTFINSIKQDFILFVDEFDKIFQSNATPEAEEVEEEPRDNKNHNQISFLNLMDGSYSGENKILFLFTTNTNVNQYLINRPSRIKFIKQYDQFPMEIAEMVCDDLLKNKKFKKDIMESIYEKYLSIDTIISIVNDVNALNKPYSTFKHIYNHRPERFIYQVKFTYSPKNTNTYYETVNKPFDSNTQAIHGYPVTAFKQKNKVMHYDVKMDGKNVKVEVELES